MSFSTIKPMFLADVLKDMDNEVVKADAAQCITNSREILILVVDDDYTSLTVVSGILKSCKYNVETVRNGVEALSTLRCKDKKIDLVMTDIHIPDMNGFELIKRISTEVHIPIVLMSADDSEQTMIKGLECGAVYFMRKPIRPEDLKNVWQYAIPKRNKESSSQSTAVIEDPNALGTHGSSSDQNEGSTHIAQTSDQVPAPTEEKTNSTVAVPDQNYEASKPKRKYKNSSEGQHRYLGASLVPRKQKLAWSTGLHNKFLDALRIIGLDRAVPKKILDVMNVPCLTRENVASHLQKYRMFLKRVSDVTEMPDGIGLNRRSKFALSYLPLDCNFQPEHLDNPDESILRKRLKQELRAIRDPLYMDPNWRQFVPTPSNNSRFATKRREFPNKQMPLMLGDRMMGFGGMRSTNQLTLGSSSYKEIMHQAAHVSNDMTHNVSGYKGLIMDNNNVIHGQMVTVQQPFGSLQYETNVTNATFSELQTGGQADIVSQGTTVDTENSRMMSQEASFGNGNMQYNANAPSQPIELPNFNNAGNGYVYDPTNDLDILAFQTEFSSYLIEQLDGGDQTINNCSEQAGSNAENPYFDFSVYSSQALQNKNQESELVTNQQFGEGSSNMIQTGNGDVQYSGGDFQPWFDQEPTQIQPENQNTNMHIADELIAMCQGLQDDVVESSYIGSSKSNNAS